MRRLSGLLLAGALMMLPVFSQPHMRAAEQAAQKLTFDGDTALILIRRQHFDIARARKRSRGARYIHQQRPGCFGCQRQFKTVLNLHQAVTRLRPPRLD